MHDILFFTATKDCQECGEAFTTESNSQKFCNSICRDNANKARYYSAPLTSKKGTTGAASELIACADLLYRGYEVFRSVSAHASCDMVALKDDIVLRIEVKTGSRNKVTGSLYYPKPKNHDVYDILMVVVKGEETVYLTPDEIPVELP
jgi:hypothetical protein